VNFDLKKPCRNCPFLVSPPFAGLGARRRREIAAGLIAGRSFSCHKTTKHCEDTGEPLHSAKEQMCAGAMLMLEAIDRPTQLMRIFERLKGYDRDALLKASAAAGVEVFPSFQAFIDAGRAFDRLPARARERKVRDLTEGTKKHG
jgi:hypothetical protein